MRGASSATAASLTSLTRCRAPRSRRSSPRARVVLLAHPPRSGPWPAPAPVAASPARGGRFARLAGRAVDVRAVQLTRPARRRHGPAASSRCGWNTSPPGEERTLLTIGRSLVGRQNLELVLRGERPTPGPLGHLRIGTLPSSIRHPTKIFDPGRPVHTGHLACHLRGVSIPSLGSLIVRGRVPQPWLTEGYRELGRWDLRHTR